ncbi:hypothetical protein AKJ09_05288 [Labilithrix luteola]|uniref:Uncharacterized protein n=1 Tax=Labilithrix luteola TaxID=1391654 RepID=A0A0K1PZP5_9BACT|nr:hypothetical protein [Labilithrix luteola]AKU98624.1 hypothetical protein AKJ09_05288 [Labilithrix luteola]
MATRSSLRLAHVARAFVLVALAAVPCAGRAEEAPPTTALDPALAAIMPRLAQYAEQFEQMKRRGSFTLSGTMDELDGGGQVSGNKSMVVRVTASPAQRIAEILKYTEDGVDKTNEERAKAAEKKRTKSSADKKKEAESLRLPFLAVEQSRYAFTLLEKDPAAPSHVRVGFVPKVPAETAYKGSAWVDADTGQVLTLGFSPSKNPRLVDHVDVTVRFELPTALGKAPSSIQFEARGSLLFFRKHYKGSATISDASIAF